MGDKSLVGRVESFLKGYCAFPDPRLSLVLALWVVGTWCFRWFDAFPYLVITAATKRAGKSRLAELLAFVSYNAKPFSAMTSAVMFRCIGDGATVIFDEAEKLSKSAANDMRSVLNVGYRRGQTIPRVAKGGEGVVEFPVYCPKVFVLIGDVFDTLRDRSIIAELARGNPARNFVWTEAEAEGKGLATELKALTETMDPVDAHEPIAFLTGREGEIWSPIFALCRALAPNRLDELTRTASDFAAIKQTTDGKRYTQLETEKRTTDEDFGVLALSHLAAYFSATKGRHKVLTSDGAVTMLKDMPTGPWRTYRGEGLSPNLLANLLSPFGVKSRSIKLGDWKENVVKRGYRAEDVLAAAAKHLQK